MNVSVLAPNEHTIREGYEMPKVCTRLSTGSSYGIETGISLTLVIPEDISM